MQIGGSDQWGNITSGIELIKKIKGQKAYALTTPLLTKSDGTKFGKTEDGNIWLDSKRTSSYKFYQYWMNVSDEDAKKWIKIFTTFSENKISEIIENHSKEPHLRILQKALAKSLTCRVHTENAYNQSVKVSNILFGKNTADQIQEITEQEFLMVFEGVDHYKVDRSKIMNGVDPVTLLTDFSEAFKSKGELRRLINSNAISINKIKLKEQDQVTVDSLLNNKYLLVQKGKKNYIILSFE